MSEETFTFTIHGCELTVSDFAAQVARANFPTTAHLDVLSAQFMRDMSAQESRSWEFPMFRTWVPYLCALPGLPRRKLRKCQMRSYQRRKRLIVRKIARSDAADKAWRFQ